MKPDESRKLTKKFTGEELVRLSQCPEHRLTKLDKHELQTLLAVLIRGHHHLPEASARRLISATRQLSERDLLWLSENLHDLIPD